MNKEEMITNLKAYLTASDSEGDLVNFVDDTVDWDLIAKIAVGKVLDFQASKTDYTKPHQFTSIPGEICRCGAGWNVPEHL
jgi:hypothetical protein